MYHWQQLLDEYLADISIRGRKSATISAYQLHLKRLVDYLNEILPWQCSPPKFQQACTEIMATKQESYKSHGSRKLFLASTKTFLRWCVALGHLREINVPHKFLDSRGKMRPTRPIRKNEAHDLLELIGGSKDKNKLRDKALLAIYAFTGIRRSAPLAMRISDYDDSQCTIRIREKGGSKKLKTVIPPLGKILSNYINHLQNQPFGKMVEGESYLFPGRSGAKPLGERQANNIFNKWKALAELHPELTIHSFRAGFATNLYMQYRDVLLVSKALGHQNPAATFSYIESVACSPEIIYRAFQPNSEHLT